MKKATLVESIAKETGFSRKEVQYILETFFEEVKHALTMGERIEIRGFGSFSTKQRAARLARNLANNTALPIPEKLVPVFKPAADFLDRVEGKAVTFNA